METNRRELIVGAGAAGLAAAMPSPVMAATAPGDAAAAATLAGIAEELLADWPEAALSLGIDKGERIALRGRFADRGAAADKARSARATAHLAALTRIDATRLSPAVAMDVDTTTAAYALATEGWQAMPVGEVAVLNPSASFRNTPFLVSQLGGAYADLPDLLENKHDVAGAADAEAYLARLDAYARALDGETARIRSDAAAGAIPPVLVIDLTAGQLKGIRATPVGEWGIVTSFAAKCAKAGLPARFAENAARFCVERIVPALDRQIAAFAAIRPGASEVPGLWQRPGGEGWYRWLVKAATTTNETPEAIHALGLEQNRAINAEIDTLLKAQGLTKGTVGERLTALSTRPDLVFSNDDAGRAKLLAYLNGRIADIRTRLPRAFGTPVKGNLVIRRVPPSIQDGAPNGYAGPGSMDGSQPGLYYINLKTTATWPRYSLPTLCYHEGLPGHIWQGEYSFRLPLIRSLLAFNAYSEGWALYAEQLAGELGVYDDDPLGRIGYLQSMNFRACRLVVDTGMHAKRWTFAQALAWFQSATGMPAVQLTAELQRYCAMPGQACGYKMGHNEINRLRTKAQGALGARYDLKAFDDVVVGTGNVPLTLLERVVDRYIARAGVGAAIDDRAGGENTMKYLTLALLAATVMIAPAGAARQEPIKSTLAKPCLRGATSDMPGFSRNGPPPVERFDLSYSARADGNVEVDLASKTNGGALLFVGSEHVSAPDPALFDYLESTVQRVKPSAVFVEVDDVSYLSDLPTDKDRVIKTRGEPSYLAFIARQAGIPVRPLELPRGELLKQLRQRFSADDVALAFVLREVQGLRDRRRLYGEALETQAARVLTEQGELARQANRPLAVRNILQLTQAVNRKWGGLDWRQVPAEWFNPFLNSDRTGSIFVNALVADEMAIRDRHTLKLLLGQVALGKRVVALAGRSHAQTQLQALNCLMKGS